MNVSNNDNQLSTIKTLAKGQVETKENFPILAGPVQRVCWGGGVLFFFATLRASRDENAACPQGLDSSRGDEGSLLGVSCLTESSGFPPPHLVYRLTVISQSHAQCALRLPEALQQKTTCRVHGGTMKIQKRRLRKKWTLTSRPKIAMLPLSTGMQLPAWATKWARHFAYKVCFV